METIWTKKWHNQSFFLLSNYLTDLVWFGLSLTKCFWNDKLNFLFPYMSTKDTMTTLAPSSYMCHKWTLNFFLKKLRSIKATPPGFDAAFFHAITVWPCPGHLSSPSCWLVLWKLNKIMFIKYLVQSLAYSKWSINISYCDATDVLSDPN